MNFSPRIAVPGLVRIKSKALQRLGIYLQRNQYEQVTMVVSAGLPKEVLDVAQKSLALKHIQVVTWIEVNTNDFEAVAEFFASLSGKVQAIVGLGGGKALDVAKYLAFLARKPYFAEIGRASCRERV